MAFSFKRRESAREGFKRLAQGRAEEALCSLERGARLETIHKVRKDIKQLRALLRLMRGALKKSEYRRCAGLLRAAAAPLGPLRDAHVKLRAFSELFTLLKGEMAPDCFRRLRGVLLEDCRRERAALAKGRADARTRQSLKQFRKLVSSLQIKASGWAAVSTGVERVYASGQASFHLARDDGGAEQFHEWRMRVKDLLYQTRVLRPALRHGLAGTDARLDELAECLGEDHDLFLLTEAALLRRLARESSDGARLMRGRIRLRQKRLRLRALALGAEFYQETPSAFCARLGKCWTSWRR